MQNLLAAIMTKTVGSALATAVGSRIYLDEAPDGAAYPNVVFFVVSSVLEKTFTEEYRVTLIQFSLRSTSAGATEITGMYNNLKALFDECSLTVAGSAFVWMKEESLSTNVEEIATAAGTVGCKAWHVDYEVRTSLN